MSNEVVSRKEFEKLEQKVNELEDTIVKNSSLLNQIDKKVDGILIKLEDGNTINNLTLQPINARVSKLEENQAWLWRTSGAAIIGIVIKLIFDVTKLIK